MEKLESLIQTDNPFFMSMVIFGGSIIVAIIIRLFLGRIVRSLVKHTEAEIDDLVLKRVKGTSFWLILLVGLKFSLGPLQLSSTAPDNTLDSIIIVLIIQSIAGIVGDIIEWWRTEWAEKTESTLDDHLLPLLSKILKAVVYVLGAVLVIDIWEITPLLAALGVGGLAVGLALQGSLANVFSGIQLMLDDSFRIGDKIQLESGELGNVLDIGLRSTKLKTYDNEVIYIPNSQLANSRLKNYTRPDASIRVSVNFGVEYGNDIDQVKEVVLNAIKQLEFIVDYPEPQVLFMEMADFSLNFVARTWVSDFNQQFGVKLEMTQVIYDALNKANIGIPFPTRTVYIETDSSSSLGKSGR